MQARSVISAQGTVQILVIDTRDKDKEEFFSFALTLRKLMIREMDKEPGEKWSALFLTDEETAVSKRLRIFPTFSPSSAQTLRNLLLDLYV